MNDLQNTAVVTYRSSNRKQQNPLAHNSLPPSLSHLSRQKKHKEHYANNKYKEIKMTGPRHRVSINRSQQILVVYTISHLLKHFIASLPYFSLNTQHLKLPLPRKTAQTSLLPHTKNPFISLKALYWLTSPLPHEINSWSLSALLLAM